MSLPGLLRKRRSGVHEANSRHVLKRSHYV